MTTRTVYELRRNPRTDKITSSPNLSRRSLAVYSHLTGFSGSGVAMNAVLPLEGGKARIALSDSELEMAERFGIGFTMGKAEGIPNGEYEDFGWQPLSENAGKTGRLVEVPPETRFSLLLLTDSEWTGYSRAVANIRLMDHGPFLRTLSDTPDVSRPRYRPPVRAPPVQPVSPPVVKEILLAETSFLGTQILFVDGAENPRSAIKDVGLGVNTIGWVHRKKLWGWDQKELQQFLAEERAANGVSAIPLELYVGMLSEEAIRRIISARGSRQPLPDPVGLDVQQFFKIRFELALPSATAQNLLLPLTDMCLKY